MLTTCVLLAHLSKLTVIQGRSKPTFGTHDQADDTVRYPHLQEGGDGGLFRKTSLKPRLSLCISVLSPTYLDCGLAR